MTNISKPLNDDVIYDFPARIVGASYAGSIFVRLFLDSSVEIDSDISRDKSKNLFLNKRKGCNFRVGDFILVKVRGLIANQYLLNDRIDEEDKDIRAVDFIKNINKEEYQKKLDDNNVILSFDKLEDLRKEKQGLTNEVEKLKKECDKKEQDLLRLSKDIKTFEDTKDIEKINHNLRVEKEGLENILLKYEWLEKIKPYLTDGKNSSTDIHDETIDNPKEVFNQLSENLQNRFGLAKSFVECYLLSLFTSLIQGRFLLLTGHIGTGKSQIIKDSGRLMGGATNMIAVRPAWLDASDLLGYFDPINNRYHATDFVEFLTTKNHKTNRPNLILLDELNIARIENYGADILATLSRIDQRDREENQIKLFSENLKEIIYIHQMYERLDGEAQAEYKHLLDGIAQKSSISIPKNVVICGTLNIDGSTENLSPKMIDRSFMLKFPDFDGVFRDIKEFDGVFDIPINALIDTIKNTSIDKAQDDWNNFYERSVKGIKDMLIPISNRIAKDYVEFSKIAQVFGVDRQLVNSYFFYSRILPRLNVPRVDEEKRKAILERLNSLKTSKNNDCIYRYFIDEIRQVKDGDFIDYQHICG